MRSRYQGRYQPRTASKYAGRGPSALGEGVGGSILDWILVLGTWADAGFWRDNAVWKDS